jgi:membrane protease YdiL (CAAX protease family)
LLLPLSLTGLLIQVSAEELVFRGYLQQQLAARFATPLIWAGVPALLFGLAHHDTAMGGNVWLVVIWAGLFGLLMADLTARAGTLGPAIAVHFVNNFLGLLVIAPAETLSGLALYTYTFSLADTAMVRQLLPVDFALMLVSWLAARLALRR